LVQSSQAFKLESRHRDLAIASLALNYLHA